MKTVYTFISMTVLCALAAPALAVDESPWSQDARSTIRLVAGANTAAEAPLRAGIEIKLQPGWKTYWRYPGDSGVPPRFDFSGSTNLKSARVLYPAPHLFSDDGEKTLGYKGTVIFPLQVTPAEPDKPVTLKLKLDYAVCEKLCIPAEGNAELALQHGASSQDGALAAAEAQVPKQVSAQTLGLTVKRITDTAKPRVAVELTSAAPVEVFVEGPTAEWALPIPTPTPASTPDRRAFGFELDGLPPGSDPKGPIELTFTVVGGGQALEAKSRLD